MAQIVAFLATRLSAAQTDIRHGWTIMSVSGQDRGEVIYDGATRPFRIVTRDEQLGGMELYAFEVLKHASANIPAKLIDVALAHMGRAAALSDLIAGDADLIVPDTLADSDGDDGA